MAHDSSERSGSMPPTSAGTQIAQTATAAGIWDDGAVRARPPSQGMRAIAPAAHSAPASAPTAPHTSSPRLSARAAVDATATASPHPATRASRPARRLA
jgi:hypothetical protein